MQLYVIDQISDAAVRGAGLSVRLFIDANELGYTSATLAHHICHYLRIAPCLIFLVVRKGIDLRLILNSSSFAAENTRNPLSWTEQMAFNTYVDACDRTLKQPVPREAAVRLREICRVRYILPGPRDLRVAYTSDRRFLGFPLRNLHNRRRTDTDGA